MQKIYLTKGLPGCGKTTWAKDFVDKSNGTTINICKDDLRAMMHNSHHSKHREHFVQEVRDNITIYSVLNNYSVIWSDTNLHPVHEARARELAEDLGAKVEIVDFTHIDIETCIKQDLKRFASVGERVIRENYNKFIKPKLPKVEQNKDLPRAIICDLDGTLAELNGRNAYDASGCENDLLIEAVANIVKTYHKLGYKIFLVSGRQDTHKPETERWLLKHGIEYSDLLMRVAKDQRKDSVIKEEIYNEFLKDKYYIEFILDDRPQVIRMWRSLGFTVLQLNDEEF